MHLSIVGPTIPPGAVSGEGWGFDQAKAGSSTHDFSRLSLCAHLQWVLAYHEHYKTIPVLIDPLAV